jgi:hypothetical protein
VYSITHTNAQNAHTHTLTHTHTHTHTQNTHTHTQVCGPEGATLTELGRDNKCTLVLEEV